MSSRPRAERLLDAVRALGPLVEAERASLDRDRALSPPLVDALVDAGLFRLWTPRRLGGAELDPVSGLRVIAAVAALDGSVGWNVMVASAHGFLAGRLPARPAREVFGDRRAVVAERARGRAPARPATRLVFVPAERTRIHDTWRVSGLRGTGSHDYSLERVPVPAAYAVDVYADEPTRPERLYAVPVIPFVTAAVGAVPVGIARGALEDLARLARTRRRGGRPLAEDPAVQRGIARAEIHARSAESLLLQAVDDMWRTVTRGKPPTLEQRAQVRMGCVNAGVAAAAAVDVVWELAGSGAVFEAAGLERRFRDVHVATQHVALAPRTLEVAGCVLLGLDPQGIF